MPVEDAADRAGLFNTDEFAEAAQYTAPGPGNSPVSCAIIVDRGQSRSRFDAGEQDAQSSERLVQANFDELALVERAGLFEILDSVGGTPTGESFEVRGLPKLDETQGIWTIEVLFPE